MAIAKGLFGLAATLLAGTVSSYAANAPTINDPAYAHPQKMVEVEPGRRLNLYCLGTGSPTVVFESGLGDETSAWGVVQPAIAKRTRTCSYDRAGIGFSDPARRPSTSSNIVNDLHTLLTKAQIKPPYVLVGHSYGGMNAVLYADRYRSEVAAMVLVDPAHENQVLWQRSFYPRYDKVMLAPALASQRTCLAQSQKGFTPGTEIYKTCIDAPNRRLSANINAIHIALYQRPSYRAANLSEMESIRGGTSGVEVRAERRSFGDMPLTVLTRSPNPGPLPGETEASSKAAFKAWFDMHNDLASRSSCGKNTIVAHTDHYIQYDQPQVVINAINGVLDVVKSGRGCSIVR